MPKPKQKLLSRDLLIQADHLGASFVYNSKHPVRSVEALRLILSAAEELRPSISHDLYKERLAMMGAFGVPCFIVNGQFYWGQDRLFFAERALGRILAKQRRVLRLMDFRRPHTLLFYHDFSSPWSFFASLQVESIARETGAILVYKPFLVGAVFKSIGTPIEPMKVLSASKASYARRDMADWSAYLGANMKFPSVFPIRSVMALRIAICDASVTNVIYRAAWVDDKEIANKPVLLEVLKEAEFDINTLMNLAESDTIKEQLRKNTNEVLALGGCGAPTFHVLDPDGKHVALIWGQDRLNVVADMLCGWRPKTHLHQQKLSSETAKL